MGGIDGGGLRRNVICITSVRKLRNCGCFSGNEGGKKGGNGTKPRASWGVSFGTIGDVNERQALSWFSLRDAAGVCGGGCAVGAELPGSKRAAKGCAGAAFFACIEGEVGGGCEGVVGVGVGRAGAGRVF